MAVAFLAMLLVRFGLVGRRWWEQEVLSPQALYVGRSGLQGQEPKNVSWSSISRPGQPRTHLNLLASAFPVLPCVDLWACLGRSLELRPVGVSRAGSLADGPFTAPFCRF